MRYYDEKFIIAIEETVVDEFEVVAEDADEAMRIAEEKYNDCEFVLCPGKLKFKQMSIIKPEDEVTEWVEF